MAKAGHVADGEGNCSWSLFSEQLGAAGRRRSSSSSAALFLLLLPMEASLATEDWQLWWLGLWWPAMMADFPCLRSFLFWQ